MDIRPTSAGSNARDVAPVRVRILAFARARELLGASDRTMELPAGATIADAWSALIRAFPRLQDDAATTRIARNGKLVPPSEPVCDGDELALLPPVGGG
jgi:molybdopterin synthase catalytic subunit